MDANLPQHRPEDGTPPKKRPGIVFVLAGGHALALLLLYVGTQQDEFRSFGWQVARLCWLGLICGQISLAAIFGALAPLPPLIRLSFALIAAAMGWGLLLAGLPIASSFSGAWAAMVALQFAIVAAGAFLLRIFVRRAEGESARSLLGQYSLSTLLAWITLIAVVLGLLRWAFGRFGWNESVLRWEWFLHVQVIGMFNAALALVGLASVIGSRWPRLRRTWGLVIGLVIIFHEPFLLDLIFRAVGADYADVWIIGVVQIVTTFLTLHVIRQAGGLEEQVPPLRSSETAC